MAIKFPDILKHENDEYAIVNINDIRGISSVNDVTSRNNIPLDKRILGNLVSIIGDSVYHYRGSTLNDIDWINVANWRALGVTGTNNFVQFFTYTTDIPLNCNHDYYFVCCLQTGQIYTYIPSAPTYVVDNYYILATQDGGDSRFVSLLYNINLRSHEEIITCDGITNDYIINHNLDVKYVDLRCFDVITNEKVEVYYKPIDYMSAMITFDTPVPNNLEFFIVVKQ